MKYWYLTPLSRVARVTSLVLVILVLAGTAWAGSSGRCHSATISSEVVLPDGSVHGPGILTSCAQRTYSPTSTLLELSIDGHPIHMVISRSGQCQAPSEVKEAFFVFHLNTDNRLVLQGYVVPKRGDILTYAMHPDSDHYEVTSTWAVLVRDYDAGKPQDPSMVLIAARR